MCLLILLLQPFWLLVSRLFDASAAGNVQGDSRSGGRMRDAAFSILAAAAVAVLFQLYPGNCLLPDVDPSVFLYIGRRMVAGRLPYRELFDHKGPILYLIQYAGALFSRSGSGVWVFEVLNLTFTFYIQLLLNRLITGRRCADWVSILLVFGMCGWNVYQGGNFAEEYALPWISLGLYVFLRFFRTGEVRFGQIVLLGFSFGVVFLLRVNMAAVWLALTPVVFIVLIRNKRTDRILPCMLSFIIGCAAVMVPVLLWAASKGFLKELWECYFLFNFRYADEAALRVGEVVRITAEMLRTVWPGVLAMVIALFCCLLHGRGERAAGTEKPEDGVRKVLLAALFAFLISLFCAQMSGRAFAHYAMILLPLLTVPTAVCMDAAGEFWARLFSCQTVRDVRIASVFSAAVILAGALWYAGSVPPDEAEQNPMAQFLLQNTQEDDDVLVLGNSCWLYLVADRHTENRFFFQTPPVLVSEEIRAAFLKELEEKTPDVVLAPGCDIAEADGWLSDVYRILTKKGFSCTFNGEYGVLESTAPES